MAKRTAVKPAAKPVKAPVIVRVPKAPKPVAKPVPAKAVVVPGQAPAGYGGGSPYDA